MNIQNWVSKTENVFQRLPITRDPPPFKEANKLSFSGRQSKKSVKIILNSNKILSKQS